MHWWCAVGVVWSASPTQFCLTNKKLLPPPLYCNGLDSSNNRLAAALFPFYPRTQASRVMYSGLSIYIYMCTKKIVIERSRDLIYLKFVATDFFLKIISPSAGENSGDLA